MVTYFLVQLSAKQRQYIYVVKKLCRAVHDREVDSCNDLWQGKETICKKRLGELPGDDGPVRGTHGHQTLFQRLKGGNNI